VNSKQQMQLVDSMAQPLAEVKVEAVEEEEEAQWQV